MYRYLRRFIAKFRVPSGFPIKFCIVEIQKFYTRPRLESTVVEQAAACALVTQRARVRSPVGTSFLG